MITNNSKRGVVTSLFISVFTIGVIFGGLLNYLLSLENTISYYWHSVIIYPHWAKIHHDQHLKPISKLNVPDHPHSESDTDATEFTGFQYEQSWNDMDAYNHLLQDDDLLRQKVFQGNRIVCWVMTSPSNIPSKARHIKATWGSRCHKLLFMSSETDDKLPAIGLTVPEGRNFLWGKTKRAFQYIYDHHINDGEWFLKADDDTYVIVENLHKLLLGRDPKEAIYFGRRFKPYVEQGYMSGGAGYVLSKEAVRRFVQNGLNHPYKCRQDDGGAEDLEIGSCLQELGVSAQDSRDEFGRERFHPFIPEHHLISGLIPHDNWYWKYNFYPTKEGLECCSDTSITFHYVAPNMMYVLDYFVYHLKAYGISDSIVTHAKSKKSDYLQEMEARSQHMRSSQTN